MNDTDWREDILEYHERAIVALYGDQATPEEREQYWQDQLNSLRKLHEDHIAWMRVTSE